MDWKPNKWIAALLGLFVQPLGLLYVARPVWAFVCLALLVVIAWVGVVVPLSPIQETVYNICTVAVAVITAVVAFVAARSYERRMPRPRYTRWYALLTAAVCFVVLVLAVRAFFVEPFRMPAMSMLPTLSTGSGLIVKKWGYGNYRTVGVSFFRNPMSAEMKRGEIYVFEYPKRRSVYFVKRLIGLPGDKVTYKNKALTINDRDVPMRSVGSIAELTGNSIRPLSRYDETLGDITYSIAIDDTAPALYARAVQPFPMREKCTYSAVGVECHVPPGHYFMMGDSRDNSDDSRYWGFVPENAIVGKVVSILPKEAALLRRW
jgi:signal peptidase I